MKSREEVKKRKTASVMEEARSLMVKVKRPVTGAPVRAVRRVAILSLILMRRKKRTEWRRECDFFISLSASFD